MEGTDRSPASKYRHRLRAFEDDQRSAQREPDPQEGFHRLPAFEHGVVHIGIHSLLITLRHETGESRITKTSPRITPQSKSDGRTTAEIKKDAQHSYLSAV